MNRVRPRTGRRGSFLITLGILQVVIGWTILHTPPQATRALTIFRVVPQTAQGLLWFMPGVAAIVAAATRRHLLEAGAFAVAYLALYFWGAAYFLSWAIFHEIDFDTAIRASVIYWSFSSLVLIASGWYEPGGFVPPPWKREEERK